MDFPERIYLIDCNPAFAIKQEGDTEYIRKDVVDNMLQVAEDHAYLAGQEAMKEKLIDKACEWLESNVEKYIYNATPSYPDADFKACVGGKCWEYFRKAMQNG